MCHLHARKNKPSPLNAKSCDCSNFFNYTCYCICSWKLAFRHVHTVRANVCMYIVQVYTHTLLQCTCTYWCLVQYMSINAAYSHWHQGSSRIKSWGEFFGCLHPLLLITPLLHASASYFMIVRFDKMLYMSCSTNVLSKLGGGGSFTPAPLPLD